MEKQVHPDNHDLYRLPWSVNDSPIGWLEITDTCNIECEGCYRSINGEGHKPLEQVKEEILFLKKWRNCDGISISGGEAVLHPDILQIISFVKKNGMKSIMLTNGVALNDELLIRLKKAGLTGLSFHIDSTQKRPDLDNVVVKDELAINDLRLKHARMLKKAGLYAHFGITVHKNNLEQVPRFIQWAVDNMKLISGISLIIYREMPTGREYEYFAADSKIEITKGDLGYAGDGDISKNQIRSRDVYKIIKEAISDYDANSYLGGTEDHTSLKWLLGNIIVNSKGKSFGAFGKKTMEYTQVFHHLLSGTYITYPRKRIGKKIFIAAFFDHKVKRALARYLKYVLINPVRLFYEVNTFGIGIVQGPDIMPDGRVDMCDDCPDLCVYEGRLVSSCRLDECRKYGTLLHVHKNQEEHEGHKKHKEKAVEEILS